MKTCRLPEELVTLSGIKQGNPTNRQHRHNAELYYSTDSRPSWHDTGKLVSFSHGQTGQLTTPNQKALGKLALPSDFSRSQT